MHPHRSRATVSVKHFSPALSPQPHATKPKEAKLRLMTFWLSEAWPWSFQRKLFISRELGPRFALAKCLTVTNGLHWYKWRMLETKSVSEKFNLVTDLLYNDMIYFVRWMFKSLTLWKNVTNTFILRQTSSNWHHHNVTKITVAWLTDATQNNQNEKNNDLENHLKLGHRFLIILPL